MKTVISLLSALALSTVAGCGAHLVPTPAEVARRYPDARYIVGLGYAGYHDLREQADAARRAEADARARVAEQVRSRVQSTLRVQTEHRAGAEREDIQAHVETTAVFERAELIEVVQRVTRCTAGRCEALAVLSRERAAAGLVDAYALKRPALLAALEGAEEAKDDPVRFTQHYREVRRQLPELATLAGSIEVLGRGQHPPYREDRARADALATVAQGYLARPVNLVVAGLPEGPLGQALLRALTAGFRDIGLAALPGEPCAERLSFVPAVAVECGPGALGRTCRLNVEGRLHDCSREADMAQVDFSGLQLRAAHPRDEERARQLLEAKVAGASLADALRAGLDDVLPLAEPAP